MCRQCGTDFLTKKGIHSFSFPFSTHSGHTSVTQASPRASHCSPSCVSASMSTCHTGPYLTARMYTWACIAVVCALPLKSPLSSNTSVAPSTCTVSVQWLTKRTLRVLPIATRTPPGSTPLRVSSKHFRCVTFAPVALSSARFSPHTAVRLSLRVYVSI